MRGGGSAACPCCGGAGRRGAMRAALGLAAAGGLAVAWAPVPAAAQAAAGGAPRRLSILRLQTGDRFDGAYWRDGRYDREALARLDWLVRDAALGEAPPLDPRVFDVLATVARPLG